MPGTIVRYLYLLMYFILTTDTFSSWESGHKDSVISPRSQLSVITPKHVISHEIKGPGVTWHHDLCSFFTGLCCPSNPINSLPPFVICRECKWSMPRPIISLIFTLSFWLFVWPFCQISDMPECVFHSYSFIWRAEMAQNHLPWNGQNLNTSQCDLHNTSLLSVSFMPTLPSYWG